MPAAVAHPPAPAGMEGSYFKEAAASLAARAFFWPSLAWNVTRERLDSSWHWCDPITEVGACRGPPHPSLRSRRAHIASHKAPRCLLEGVPPSKACAHVFQQP